MNFLEMCCSWVIQLKLCRSHFDPCTWARRPTSHTTVSSEQIDTITNISILLPTISADSVSLVKLFPTAHLLWLRNARIAPILLQPVLFCFFLSFSLCQISTCPTPLSIVHWDCTTLCDFLHSLLYRPHYWRLTIWMSFIRSLWPSCKAKKCTTLYA